VAREQEKLATEYAFADGLTRLVSERRKQLQALSKVEAKLAKTKKIVEEKKEAEACRQEFLRVTPHYVGVG